MASVRYIVDDVDVAIAFYERQLGFREVMHPAPAFGMVVRGDLRLLLSAPVGEGEPGGGSRPLADGTVQRAGGFNRVVLEVEDLEGVAERLRGAGVRFRSEVITGVGGRQVVIEDPAGNPVELFEPVLPEARERAAFGDQGP